MLMSQTLSNVLHGFSYILHYSVHVTVKFDKRVQSNAKEPHGLHKRSMESKEFGIISHLM